MPEKISLKPAEREFWNAVAQAAFTNAFGDQRLELDHKIAGDFGNDENARAEALRETVSKRVEKFLVNGKADYRLFAAEDSDVMRFGFLFEVFHRFYRHFDQLILEQLQAGNASVSVGFAKETFQLLTQRGFTMTEAVRFFGIFYQLRRAQYFIVHGLIGKSPCIKELRLHLWNNIFTHDIRWYDKCLWNRMEDFSTLLLGETGTGKGAASAAIGRSGYIPFDEKKGCFVESFARNFISLNLSQFPESLIESELFGHRKGAFTGAIETHEGVFARCSPHGAIFLDEIGDISVPIQIKLLQVLQERTFSAVGSHDKQRFRGRVIAATNKSLDDLRQKKLFRDDFFYRLCSDVVVVPPLRQRLQESPKELNLLLEHIVTRLTGEKSPELVDMTQERLLARVGLHYAWPGNVRELEQAVRRILLTQNYNGDYSGSGRDLGNELASAMDRGALKADELLAGYCALLYQRHGTFEEVARRTALDPRTVKKYLEHKSS